MVTPDGLDQVIDLDQLFAPPSATEINVIMDDWKSRNIAVIAPVAVKSGVLGGHQCEVIVHNTGQYFFLRFPRTYVPGNTYDVLVWNHPSYNGVDVSVLNWFDYKFLPSEWLKENAFYVVPSYRGEALHVPTWGTYHSAGDPSKADYDVDDSFRALDYVTMNFSTGSVFLYGQSRGATVTLLQSVRASLSGVEVYKVAEIFGGTYCFLDYIKADCLVYLRNQTFPSEKVSALVVSESLIPWIRGEIELEEARARMIRRSPALFAQYLQPITLHHGKKDTAVEFTHFVWLSAELSATSVPYDAHEYADGVHDPDTLSGCGAFVWDWFSR